MQWRLVIRSKIENKLAVRISGIREAVNPTIATSVRQYFGSIEAGPCKDQLTTGNAAQL